MNSVWTSLYIILLGIKGDFHIYFTSLSCIIIFFFFFPDELISVENGCECNVAKGYWGDDSRNCQLNINNCKQAGQQLRKTDGIVFYA